MSTTWDMPAVIRVGAWRAMGRPMILFPRRAAGHLSGAVGGRASTEPKSSRNLAAVPVRDRAFAAPTTFFMTIVVNHLEFQDLRSHSRHNERWARSVDARAVPAHGQEGNRGEPAGLRLSRLRCPFPTLRRRYRCPVPRQQQDSSTAGGVPGDGDDCAPVCSRRVGGAPPALWTIVGEVTAACRPSLSRPRLSRPRPRTTCTERSS